MKDSKIRRRCHHRGRGPVSSSCAEEKALLTLGWGRGMDRQVRDHGSDMISFSYHLTNEVAGQWIINNSNKCQMRKSSKSD